ncbi:MAG: DUF1684 domain-containing protein [Chloroflexi bacterium]|nr:DUF1684 domain-containing protein [Chloroflexota bacterium]
MNNKDNASYITEIAAWRKQREADLRAPDSWLSLAGLFVLKNGYNTIGSAQTNDIILPTSAPDELGLIEFRDGQASLHVTTTVPVFVDGELAQRATLVDNADHKKPTLITVGDVSFFVHTFSGQAAIRVKDRRNPLIKAFAGCEWYAVKPEYRVQGKFVPHTTPRAIPIKTTVNTPTQYKSVGVIEFTLDGQALSFAAQDYGIPNELAIVFRDATSGHQTYGPARFLTVAVDAEGNAVVDFNKAYNPPCAFTPYATCPLPPRENILSVPIEAGERYTENGAHGHSELREEVIVV